MKMTLFIAVCMFVLVLQEARTSLGWVSIPSLTQYQHTSLYIQLRTVTCNICCCCCHLWDLPDSEVHIHPVYPSALRTLYTTYVHVHDLLYGHNYCVAILLSLISQEVCGTPTCPSGHTFHKDNCECFISQPPTCSGTLIPSNSHCHIKSTPKCSSRQCILNMKDCTCVENPINTGEYLAQI